MPGCTTTRRLLQQLAVQNREQRDRGAAWVTLQPHSVYIQPQHGLCHPCAGRRSVRILNTPWQDAEESPCLALSTFVTPGT